MSKIILNDALLFIILDIHRKSAVRNLLCLLTLLGLAISPARAGWIEVPTSGNPFYEVRSIFFIDEAQRVTLKDVGTVEEIRRRAAECGADVHELELASQFRCNGSDGYLAWVDRVEPGLTGRTFSQGTANQG